MSAFTTVRMTRERAEEMILDDILENREHEIKKMLTLLTDEQLEEMADRIGEKHLYNYTIIKESDNNG